MMNADVHTAHLSQRAARLSITPAADLAAGAISFDSGHAFPGILPDLSREAVAALTAHRSETLQYSPRPGLPALRDWIAQYLREDGIAGALPEHILITNGAKQALELVCRVLLDEGDSIVVTAPTYFTAIPIFRSFGVEFIEIPQDSEGLCVQQLEQHLECSVKGNRRLPKFIYDVPDFHNPTGVTMSRPRRQQLLQTAEKYGLWIVEDSPYRKVRFEGESCPSLKALDRTDRVVGLGTFSKLLAPGLRVGWLCGPSDMINRAVQLKSDGGSCPLTQRIILEYCRSGRLPKHIDVVQHTYRGHRDRMVAALRRELTDAHFAVPQGGYYLWLTFPDGIDCDLLASRARDEGAITLPGSKFYAAMGGDSAGPPRNQLRIAYSHVTLEEIDEGISRVARAYRSGRS